MCDLRAHLARKRSRVKTSAYHRALGGDVCNPPATAAPQNRAGVVVTPSASRSQPRPVTGRKHAVKRLDIELKNLKRVFALLDVGKDGVVTSEDIFVITGWVT